jgi:CubicO group peptidase (beta-lactamase class C family)
LFSDDVPGFNLAAPYTPEQIIGLVRDQPLVAKPGTEFHYSNAGYDILGYIIEKVSGEPYAQFVRDNIFRPLGMANTGLGQDGVTVPNLAVGYTDALHLPAPTFDLTTAYASAGLYSTVGDLNIWDQALTTERLVPTKVLNLMFTVYSPPHASVGYGYEWEIISVSPSHRVAFHDGSYPGVSTINEVFLDDGLNIIVLSNESADDVDAIAGHLAAMALQGNGLPRASRLRTLSALSRSAGSRRQHRHSS